MFLPDRFSTALVPAVITLVVLVLIALIALAASWWHERRRARRGAERSQELERLSAELLQANRAKSEFLANVSHELRTPLNAIVGFVELLRDGVYGELSPDQVTPVGRIESSANHLRHLVDQILDLAKITAGRLEVHPESVALRMFILDLVTELEPMVGEKGLDLSIAVSEAMPRIRTDPSHLRQILVNLVGNAVKYTPAGGIVVQARMEREAPTEVTVARTAADRSPYISLELPIAAWFAIDVVDTGIGIEQSDCTRIFEEFAQGRLGAGDGGSRGTGLGLTISRRLARLLGGEITLQSAVGKGSTFTLWLPAFS